VFSPTNDQLLFINELDNKTTLLMAMDLSQFGDSLKPKVEQVTVF
jgi:hypothetical protein